MEKFMDIILSLLQKLPLPYFVAVIFIVAGTLFLISPKVKEFLYGPEWDYLFDKEADTAVFKTDTKLRSGKITVRTQLELEYGDKVFYILEIQGLYNINQISLIDASAEGNDMDVSDEIQESKFCMIVEKQQRDTLDDFETSFKNLLEEYLKKEYKGDFYTERFEINEIQIAIIDYQSLNMNRSRPMYVIVSGEETSTVKKSEVIMRSPNTSINLDELNLLESFYNNEGIMRIITDCIQEIELE